MDATQKTVTMDRKVLLSTIWIFAAFNYLYCDVLSVMDSGFTQAIPDWKSQWHGVLSGIPAGSRDIGGDPDRHGSVVQSVEVQS